MNTFRLKDDPYNLIITGVGGQGNVLASRMIGDMLSMRGLDVTIGETFGASQRGGSVMSHLRVSTKGSQSPQIPKAHAHVVVSLEPTEALRVLKNYGNSSVKVITNMRPVRPVGVICGEQAYPAQDQIKQWLEDLSARSWCINTTEEAIKLGNPIFSNVMMVGALSAVGDLPLTREDFKRVIRIRLPKDKVTLNLTAFEIGWKLVG